MPQLKDKVRNALDETRMLVLGLQILLGFKFNSAFHPGFDRLPWLSHGLLALSLAALLIAFTLLLLPASFHRLVEGGEDTPRMHRTTSLLATMALVPFAAALGLDFGVAFAKAFGARAGIAAGGGAGILAFVLWYGIEFIFRREGADPMRDRADERTSLKDRIAQVLVEARIVLPGAQALLGFQLAAYFTDAFERLPMAARVVHSASALCIGLTVLLLMTPPAYHRIAERGEDTPEFDRLASRFVLGALVPLAFGLAGETYVFLVRAFGDATVALAASVCAAFCMLTAWFLLPVLARGRRRPFAAPTAGD
jgi:Family of unknown function (DUF6328)